ncbi:hypothetical protein LSH36_215g03000 [Paralvinella palmiformis]|uniref:Uncharacterized protein n=1 Tax=Paralvinella palmiformis TaxID=53620 RepID=A0AAD9JP73_9ANNE|nr:hypothetical protein LSH36_215g03000 [Paralvinella palmiformis]
MGVGLSCAGVFWAILSFLSLGAACVGFYLPYWLEGEIHLNGESIPTFIGVFRRCHYLRLSAHGDIEVVRECGRYETFFDIPSQWWQISTVTISAGCILLLFVSVAGIFSCCVQGVLSHTSAKVAGVLQFIAAKWEELVNDSPSDPVQLVARPGLGIANPEELSDARTKRFDPEEIPNE